MRTAPGILSADRDNIRRFWNAYLKSKTPLLLVVFGMIIAQGFVYQQFLSLTETGLPVIFESGGMGDLIRVCLMVFGVFALRGVMSYAIRRISV